MITEQMGNTMGPASDEARAALHSQIAAQEAQVNKTGFRRRIAFLLVVLVAAAVFLAAAIMFVIWPQIQAYHQFQGTSPDPVFWTGLFALGLLFLAILFVIQRYVYQAFDTLEELRLDVIGATQGVRDLPRKWFQPPKNASEVDLFAQSLALLAESNQNQRRHAEGQMGAIIAALDHGILAITPNGIVTAANRHARQRLGAGAVREGTSIFAALQAEDLLAALNEAKGRGAPVSVELRDNKDDVYPARVADLGVHGGQEAGFVLLLDPAPKTAQDDGNADATSLDADEDDDSPPPMISYGAAGPGLDTPLTALPFFAMAMATTQEGDERERILSLAAVRLHGRRIYHQTNFDRLVNPDTLIPVESSRVHGISNFQVKDEPLFPAVWEEFASFTRGGIIVGYDLDRMLSVLDGDLTRAGLGWDPLMTIDVAHLFQRMNDEDVVPSLNSLAQDFAISTYGRHTAMGDALIIAQIFARQLARMPGRGVESYGQLLQVLEDTHNPIPSPSSDDTNQASAPPDP